VGLSLITKDVNLRMKARAFGLLAQDLTMDQVESDNLNQGVSLVENVDPSLIDLLYQEPHETGLDMFDAFVPGEFANQYLILRNGSKKSALAKIDKEREVIKLVRKNNFYGVEPRNAEQTFALEAISDPEISLVGITGRAGTGKTLLALAVALEKKSFYRQIFIGKPTIPLSNRDSGYLPGGITEKLEPFMDSIEDNFSVIQDLKGGRNGEKTIKDLKQEEKIVTASLAHIRGRNLAKKFFVIDEAQNLTPNEVKTIVSRAAVGTKMVFTGDVDQIDHPYLGKKSNGLSYMIDKMKKQKIFAHVHMVKGERSELANLAAELL